ncbi:class I SAM-dependent DNA methyltransferase [Sediminibacterium sp. TEGAF015]|uniref:class I SAM-dependent DNA methyltransferase n=1 Tax=Sediminibacterium sp. TEGAF015 TaxID=575378 RepID=UPI00220C45F8|nr:class I SAM-dependent methyltransferase [Sediminibacterium sp. TEGAF015]BDQ10926.1 hypothetical protein TEGAF0_01430 [Sediminibacterium sp. TEGAF015]
MSNIQQAYNSWSEQYDTNENKTRDLEAIAIRNALEGKSFKNCLEIGCGTGKNTLWLKSIAKQVLAIDLSEKMLNKAKEKITDNQVKFIQADITHNWYFAATEKFDLATFSLMLEHIENLEPIFQQLSLVMESGATVYIGELHPFKQYNGSKARFDTEEGTQVVTCFNHHISDFVTAAKKYHFQLTDINEYFDEDDSSSMPRILQLLFCYNP